MAEPIDSAAVTTGASSPAEVESDWERAVHFMAARVENLTGRRSLTSE
jgi:hypothetical protein